jgi:phytoene dehydrogenase-like protein
MMEVVVPTAIEPEFARAGQHVLSITVRGLPAAPEEGRAALSKRLAERVVSALECRMKNLRAHITGIHFDLPDASTRDSEFSVSRILSPYRARIATPLNGLFLCGLAAEPMDAVSGRAGRLAAGMAQKWLSVSP